MCDVEARRTVPQEFRSSVLYEHAYPLGKSLRRQLFQRGVSIPHASLLPSRNPPVALKGSEQPHSLSKPSEVSTTRSARTSAGTFAHWPWDWK